MIVEEFIPGHQCQLPGYGKFAGGGQPIDENKLQRKSPDQAGSSI
jgi:hypothetical protein